MDPQRIERIVAFLARADELKAVQRASYTTGGGTEDSAQHSWHAALFAVLLAGELQLEVDLARVLELIAIHDLVEIVCGDIPAFDDIGLATQVEVETEAARELYALLPPDLEARLHALRDELEAGETPEARLAAAMDRIQALAQNVATDGRSWRENGFTRERSRERTRRARELDPALEAFCEWLYERAEPLWPATP